LRAFIVFVATGAYTGFGPVISGTWGTLPAVLLWWAIAGLPAWAYATFVAALTAFGTWICGRAGEIFHSKDSGMIVIDEIAGYLVTVAFLPWSAKAAWIGFLWFRVFDMAKPWPIRWVDENVAGGWGVMADDLVAAVFAAIATRVTLAVW